MSYAFLLKRTSDFNTGEPRAELANCSDGYALR